MNTEPSRSEERKSFTLTALSESQLAGLRVAVRSMAPAAIFLPVVCIIECWGQPQFGLAMIVSSAFAIALAACILSIPRWIRSGTWTIDEEGVHVAPVRGEPRFISWAEVDRVRWHGEGISLQSEEARIGFCWSQVEADEGKKLQEFLYEILQTDFDLPAPLQPASPAESRQSLLTLLRGMSISGLLGILGTVPIAGMFFYVAVAFPSTSYLEACTKLFACIFLAVPLLVFWLITRRTWHHRRTAAD